jgi:hypothetical protein
MGIQAYNSCELFQITQFREASSDHQYLKSSPGPRFRAFFALSISMVRRLRSYELEI